LIFEEVQRSSIVVFEVNGAYEMDTKAASRGPVRVHVRVSVFQKPFPFFSAFSGFSIRVHACLNARAIPASLYLSDIFFAHVIVSKHVVLAISRLEKNIEISF